MEKLSLQIRRDDDPLSPLEWDTYGTFVCFHPKYVLGHTNDLQKENFNSWDEIEQYLIDEYDAVVILPLYLYDHGAISISTTSFYGRAQHAGWDSMRLGFIYTTRKDIEKMQGWKRLTKARIEKINEYLRAEVEEYDQYLRGDVFGYVITDENGDVIDSCWGFYGWECVIEEGIEMLKTWIQSDLEVSYD